MTDIMVWDPRTQQITTVQHQPGQPMPRYTVDQSSSMWTGTQAAPAGPAPAARPAPSSNVMQPYTSISPHSPNPLTALGLPHPGPTGFGAMNFFGTPPPEAPPAAAHLPAPPPNFGTPQIPQDVQDALTVLQGLTTQDYGGTVTAPQLPQAPTYTADPGTSYMDTRAASRDAQLQDLLKQSEGRVMENDPSQHSTLGRLGEWLSAWAASGDWGQGGNLMAQIRRRDMADQNAIADRVLGLEMAGLDSGDSAAAAHAASLSGEHSATERTGEAAYNRGASQAGLDTQVNVANANAGARTAQARAEATRSYLAAMLDAHGRAQQQYRTNLGLIGQDPQYTAPAAGALAHDMTEGNPGQQGPLAGALVTRQAEQGLMAYVQSLAGTRRGTPGMQQALNTLHQFDPTLRDDEVEAMVTSNPAGLIYRLLSGPNAHQALQANQPLLMRYAGIAGLTQPTQ